MLLKQIYNRIGIFERFVTERLGIEDRSVCEVTWPLKTYGTVTGKEFYEATFEMLVVTLLFLKREIQCLMPRRSV